MSSSARESRTIFSLTGYAKLILAPGLPDWAISRELGYPKVLFATDFYDGRFANFWATRNFHERILVEQILSFSVSLFV